MLEFTYYNLNTTCMINGTSGSNDEVCILSYATSMMEYAGKIETILTFSEGNITYHPQNINFNFTNCYITSNSGEYRLVKNADITLGPDDNAIVFDTKTNLANGSILASITGDALDSAKKFTNSTKSCEDVSLNLQPDIDDDLYTYSINEIGNGTDVYAACPYTFRQEPGPIFELINITPLIMMSGLIISVVAIFLSRRLNQ